MQCSLGHVAHGGAISTTATRRGPDAHFRLTNSARKCTATRATPELVDAISSLATSVAAHLPLAYEPVALPCSMMKCGDVIYRSTLDPVLRGEQTGPDWRALSLLGAIAAYLVLPPGVLPGFIDAYVGSSMYRKNSRVYSKDDIILGRKLATGGFGAVYAAGLREEDGSITPVVVKKAKEFGEAEVWMNERMVRIGGKHCAEFVTAFDDTAPSVGSVLDNSVWLVWKFEGDSTLFDMIEKKDFPYSLEPMLFGRELTKVPKGPRRKLTTVRLVMKQLLEALAACHNTGIVHRDVKPQNCIISSMDKKVKLIDLGAAADLRVGINYAPKEYLLDPRYAPPQQYVMSTQTPRPPIAPVAAFLSPVLWRMEIPDRFDMYSCGVTMLQMAFANLRNDNNIVAFNKKLSEKYKWNLREWRRQEEKKGSKEMVEGFEMLDLDGGAPWELLCSLMAYNPSERPSAGEALRHPFFSLASDSALTSTSAAFMSSASKSVGSALASPRQMLDDAITAGTKNGALTESQIAEELGLEQSAPKSSRQASNTIAWWQERQSDAEKRLGEKKKQGNSKSVGKAAAAKPAPAPAKGRKAAVAAAAPAPEPAKAESKAKFSFGALMNMGRSNGAKAESKPEHSEEAEEEVEEEEEEEVKVPAKRFSLLGMLKK